MHGATIKIHVLMFFFFPGTPRKELKHVCTFHIDVTARKILTKQRMEEIRNSDLVYFD
jgi:hypothetical protein